MVGVGAGVAAGVATGVGAGVAAGVGDATGDGEGVGAGVGLAVGAGVAVGAAVGAGVGDGVGVACVSTITGGSGRTGAGVGDGVGVGCAWAVIVALARPSTPSARIVAVIVCVPAAVGVYVTEQEAVSPALLSVQTLVGLKLPAPLLPKIATPWTVAAALVSRKRLSGVCDVPAWPLCVRASVGGVVGSPSSGGGDGVGMTCGVGVGLGVGVGVGGTVTVAVQVVDPPTGTVTGEQLTEKDGACCAATERGVSPSTWRLPDPPTSETITDTATARPPASIAVTAARFRIAWSRMG